MTTVTNGSGVSLTIDEVSREIVRLKADLADTRAELGRAMLTGREIEHENNRLRAALAAGPAALRVSQCNDRMDHDTQQISRVLDDIMQRAAVVVEAAQAAAMKGGPVSCVPCALSDKCPGFDGCPHLAAQDAAMKEGT